MKNLCLITAAIAFMLIPPPAEAVPVWVAALTSTDAGQSNSGVMSPQNEYVIECANPACIHVALTSVDTTLADGGHVNTPLTVDCTKDFTLPAELVSAGGATAITGHMYNDAGLQDPDTVVNLSAAASSATYVYRLRFNSANMLRIAAKALDAGNPSCKLIHELKNVGTFP